MQNKAPPFLSLSFASVVPVISMCTAFTRTIVHLSAILDPIAYTNPVHMYSDSIGLGRGIPHCVSAMECTYQRHTIALTTTHWSGGGDNKRFNINCDVMWFGDIQGRERTARWIQWWLQYSPHMHLPLSTRVSCWWLIISTVAQNWIVMECSRMQFCESIQCRLWGLDIPTQGAQTTSHCPVNIM